MAVTQTERMSEQAYREFALGEVNGHWELFDGYLREKPAMTVFHGDVMMRLVELLLTQLDRDAYLVRAQHA